MWTDLSAMAGIWRERRRLATFTREALEADKLRRFRLFVQHVQRASPYYADIIATRGIDCATCTPADFPVLTKPVLMANFDRIVTDRRITKQVVAEFLSRSTDPNDFLFGAYRVLHTSGTSGEVGYFVYARTDWFRGLFAGGRQRPRRRASERGRKRTGRLRFAFYGATGGHFAGVSLAKSGESGIARPFMRVGIFEVNDPLPKVIAALNDFQPHVLTGYTNALKVLAARQTDGTLRIAPLLVSASGETVTAGDRALLSQAFACDVTSTYACTEHLLMGRSEPDGDYITLHDDNLIFEFFEDHSLVTNLFNRTLPLIRYRMSDILHPLPSTAGSRHLRIRNLIGRTELMPTFVNDDGIEDFISPHTINEIFVAGVTKFQLQMTGPASFDFLVCLDPALESQARTRALSALDARLREILAQKHMSSVRFAIEPRESIDADPRTRKFRLIVDRRDTNPPKDAAARSARV